MGVSTDNKLRTSTLSSIPVNAVEIAQADLNIKNRSRTNLFSWNGQFSPQFVEALLEQYSDGESVVLDPFAGSGTTVYESARKGIAAYGVELNPSAYYMAKLYELCQSDKNKREQIVSTVGKEVDACLFCNDSISILASRFQMEPHSEIGTTLALLIVLLDVFNNDVTPQLLFEKWNRLKDIICHLPMTERKVKVNLGDARHLPFGDDSASIVLTSPPYINVFNYHQNYRRSVEALGFDVLEIAKREFGSNRKHRGNRLYTVVQYCIDMALALQELTRVCVDGARMMLVVGRESRVLGYSFFNSELIFKICEDALGLPFILRQERVFKNKFGRMIYEDIIHFENRKNGCMVSQSALSDAAREIAKNALEEKLDFDKSSKNRGFLIAAIDGIQNIQQSEAGP